MCGIAGFLDMKRSSTAGQLTEDATRMADALRHRGPDDSGVWVDASCGVALGHRRLAIVDLSVQGHQPMVSATGRYVLSFNGEIYNFEAIKRVLDAGGTAPAWRGHSDTEVMLAAFTTWGLVGALERFNGMFAFALWDRQERTLTLARDRLGEKPLYYGMCGSAFFFASELKAVRAHPSFRAELDLDAMALYLRHNYVPSPYCIYRGLAKLPAASYVSLNLESQRLSSLLQYWSPRLVAESGQRSSPLREEDAVDELEALLTESVSLRMIADVPLGAFLSGGIDSTTIVALMQKVSRRPVKTFTIGFAEDDFDEAVHARAVAAHLGTEHTELYVTPRQAMDVIPKLPSIYDEPFADSSQIPTHLVSELARSEVTVALSGDGGDELFGGYNRYFWGRNVWNVIRLVPAPLRGPLAGTLMRSGRLLRASQHLIPAAFRIRSIADKSQKLAEVLTVSDPEQMYLGLVSHWKSPEALIPGSTERPTALTDRAQWADLPDFTHRMMFLDLVTYLPDDILVKVDRASMAVALEARVPFLDHRVVEFAWRLPMRQKIRRSRGKRVLRQLLHRYVPDHLVERPKTGFGVPIGAWLRGPLREWATELLDPHAMRASGLIDPQPVQQKWRQHLEGERNWQYYLWDVLMLRAWLAAEGFS